MERSGPETQYWRKKRNNLHDEAGPGENRSADCKRDGDGEGVCAEDRGGGWGQEAIFGAKSEGQGATGRVRLRGSVQKVVEGSIWRHPQTHSKKLMHRAGGTPIVAKPHGHELTRKTICSSKRWLAEKRLHVNEPPKVCCKGFASYNHNAETNTLIQFIV